MGLPETSVRKHHLHEFTLPELGAWVASLGEPPYRVRQLAHWLYDRLEADPFRMTDLPKRLRETLARESDVERTQVERWVVSAEDGTAKALFRLSDGEAVEGVLMPGEERTTLCISTQVGCPLACAFCRTGQGRFRRNLAAGEMIDQICQLWRRIGPDRKVHVVFMGMGEPLLNLDAVLRALAILNDPLGLNLGAKRLTLSTAGFPEGIRRLAESPVKCSLAVSLNAPDDATRRRIMPEAARFTVGELLEAARFFYRRKRRRVTLEYVLLEGVNTSPQQARLLGRLTHRGPFKINLIPYNPCGDSPYPPTREETLQAFLRELLPTAPAVTVRRSRGRDIQAACGQLWTESLTEREKRG
jgi:23S rRNA (adenine2503-C2)-methyltransferase